MFKVKVRIVGNSIGLVPPKEVLAHLKVGKGDWIMLTECPDGIHIRPYDPDFERQMASAREVMREQQDVLRELAK